MQFRKDETVLYCDQRFLHEISIILTLRPPILVIASTFCYKKDFTATQKIGYRPTSNQHKISQSDRINLNYYDWYVVHFLMFKLHMYIVVEWILL